MVPPACRCVLYFFNILRNSSDVPQISVSVRIPEITATPFIPVLASFETFERLIPPIATTGIATLLHIFSTYQKTLLLHLFGTAAKYRPASKIIGSLFHGSFRLLHRLCSCAYYFIFPRIRLASSIPISDCPRWTPSASVSSASLTLSLMIKGTLYSLHSFLSQKLLFQFFVFHIFLTKLYHCHSAV